jgi:hypothetical protein
MPSPTSTVGDVFLDEPLDKINLVQPHIDCYEIFPVTDLQVIF